MVEGREGGREQTHMIYDKQTTKNNNNAVAKGNGRERRRAPTNIVPITAAGVEKK